MMPRNTITLVAQEMMPWPLHVAGTGYRLEIARLNDFGFQIFSYANKCPGKLKSPIVAIYYLPIC